MTDKEQRAASLYTRALLIMAGVTIANLGLGVMIMSQPRMFMVGMIAWLVSFVVWFEVACRTLLDKGERPWH